MITLDDLMKFGLAVLTLYFWLTLWVWQLPALGVLILSVGVVGLVAYKSRQYRREQESERVRAFLRQLKSSRQTQEAEAARIWRAFVHEDQPMRIVRGTLDWQVLDFDPDGFRLLVMPAERRYAIFGALVGVDPKTRRPFLMIVPPRVYTVPEAIEYLWQLPPGSFSRMQAKGEIYEV
jgi:hypothetical protein